MTPRPVDATIPGQLRALGRGLVLAGWAVLAGLTALAVSFALALLAVFVGVFLVPTCALRLHAVADRVRRGTVGTAVPIAAHRHPQVPAASGAKGVITRSWMVLRDPMTWREFGWSIAECLLGFLLVIAPAALVAYGLFGAVVQPFVWAPVDRAGGSNWYLFIHVDSVTAALLAIPLGLVLILIGGRIAPATLRLHARWIRFWLQPNETAQLQQRVTQLSASRSDATDAMATELRRIERDVHDGAQARLVAVGMSLGEAAELFDTDPDRARMLIETAQGSSSAALQELRDLVRGIHPPVLADRGIADALRALALDSVIDVEVTARLTGRPTAPIETAVYFAVSELLANAAKHARASTIRVELTHEDELLCCLVVDDGHGGADIGKGTGLLGVRRRIAQFDGSLHLLSPEGGPTRITLEIPCALSSPKTSSSSGTGCNELSPNTDTSSSPPSTADPHSDVR